MAQLETDAHLRSLVGRSIPTLAQGRPNRILEVGNEELIVATERSPHGEPVPLADVRAAADRLRREGELRVQPTELGHRSSFIGAVLGTLPGVETHTNPTRLTYQEPRFFLSGWAQRTWRRYAQDGMQGEALRHAASNEFRARGMRAGDLLYIVGQDDAQLQLISRLRVGAVLDQAEAEAEIGERLYEASDHAIAEPPCTAIRFDRLVPEDVARAIETEDGANLAFASTVEYRLEPQALRRDRLITASSAASLDQLLADDATETEEARAVRASVEGRRGHGTERLTPQARKAVELCGMAVTRKWLEGEGWHVKDTSATKPYDFLATRASQRLFVEVKGTTGPGEEVNLTSGEVEHFRKAGDGGALAVVREIELDARDAAHPTATGGELEVVWPWRPADEDLRALTYAYQVPAAISADDPRAG